MTISGNVLVVNAGSSSLKLHVLDEDNAVLAETHLERWSGGDETVPLQDFLRGAPTVDAVGRPRWASPRWRA